MRLNKRYIIIGIILLVTAWAGNIVYYQNHILKEPVFTKHYYDIMEGRDSFQLNYLDNIGAQRRVAGIIFPEIGPEFIPIDVRDYNSDNRYYMLKQVNVRLPEDIRGKYADKAITKAEVRLSDGKVMNVDIGKIYINSDVEQSGRELLGFESTTASSDNTGQTVYKAGADLKVHSVSSKFPELIGDILEVNVNGKPLEETSFPIELKKGDSFGVQYGFRLNKGDIRESYAYDFPIYTTVEDNEGSNGSVSSFANYWLQSPELYNVNALKENGRTR